MNFLSPQAAIHLNLSSFIICGSGFNRNKASWYNVIAGLPWADGGGAPERESRRSLLMYNYSPNKRYILYTVQLCISTSGYSQREAVFWVAPLPSQEDAVLALVQSHRSVLDRHWERGLMFDYFCMASGNRVFVTHQVEGKHSAGVGGGPRADQMPHLCLLLENEGRYRQHIWPQTESEEALAVTAAARLITQKHLSRWGEVGVMTGRELISWLLVVGQKMNENVDEKKKITLWSSSNSI